MRQNTVFKGELIDIKEQNLTNHIQEVKQKNELIKYLEKERIVEALNNTQDHKKATLIRVLWMTGVRVSEAINIKKSDINFTEKEIKILWQKRKKYHYRTIAVKPELIYALQIYTAKLKSNDKLFDYTRQRADQIVKEVLGKDVSAHMLRHSFAINFLRQTKNPQDMIVLQRLLGHKHINTTMVYLQIVPKDMHASLGGINFN